MSVRHCCLSHAVAISDKFPLNSYNRKAITLFAVKAVTSIVFDCGQGLHSYLRRGAREFIPDTIDGCSPETFSFFSCEVEI